MLKVLACIDCIHVLPPQNDLMSMATHARCGHEFDFNLVTGEKMYNFAEIVRKHGACGKEAKYFEPRQDPRYQEFDDQDGEHLTPKGAPF